MHLLGAICNLSKTLIPSSYNLGANRSGQKWGLSGVEAPMELYKKHGNFSVRRLTLRFGNKSKDVNKSLLSVRLEWFLIFILFLDFRSQLVGHLISHQRETLRKLRS